MPNYLRVIGKNRKEALDKIEQQLGHKNITILREGNIVNKKKGWFRTIEEKVFYIECVEYRKAKATLHSALTHDFETENNRVIFSPSHKAIKPEPQRELAKHYSFQSDFSDHSVTKEWQSNNSLPNPLTELINTITQKEQSGATAKPTGQNKTKPLSDYSAEVTSPPTKTAVHEQSASTHEHKKVYNFLVAREFTPKFAQKIADYFDLNILQNTETYQRLAEHIASFFTCTGIVEVKKEQANFVFLVGPTGVGKTTTLSKIASSFYTDEEHYPKPALIKFGSLDAKRIMAMEQLRKFANILRVPFKSIYGVSDFKELYKSSKKRELILVDTSGVSKQDTDLIDEIALFTNSIKSSKETHLCISAQSRYLDLKKIYQVLAKTKPSRIIITKIDESYSMGSVLSFIKETGLPISYITNGQDVPIDIITASKEKIKHILLREWGL